MGDVLTPLEFAQRFAGVALEAKTQDHPADAMLPVAREFVGEFDCDSSAWEVGDLVAVGTDEAGDPLPQCVARTTDPAQAIGRCIRRSATATNRVRVRLLSRVIPGDYSAVPVAKLVSQTLNIASFTDGGSTAGYIDFTGAGLPAGAIVLGWEADVAEAFAGDSSAAIQVGVSGDPDKFTADTSQSAFAIGVRGSAAAPATSYQASAVQPRVTITSGSDFTLVTANGDGELTVTIFYLPVGM